MHPNLAIYVRIADRDRRIRVQVQVLSLTCTNLRLGWPPIIDPGARQYLSLRDLIAYRQ